MSLPLKPLTVRTLLPALLVLIFSSLGFINATATDIDTETAASYLSGSSADYESI